MIRNYFLLNLLLIVVIAVLGNKLSHVVKHRMDIPAETGNAEVKKEESAAGHAEKILDENAVEVISSLDLFRPSRSAPSVENKAAEKPPLPNPPKLFGTVILNDNKTAILEQSDTKTTKVYRVNDTVSGYTVIDILEDKVVLMGNDEKVEVRLRDDKGVQQPARTIVRPSAAPAPQTIQQQTQRPAPQRRVRPVPPRRRPSRPVQPNTGNIAAPETPQPTPTPETPESPEADNPSDQEEEQ
ncbi:MAG: type II secretion system protein N [Nitrospirota bacterium]